jgi:hypothetical protein
LKYLFNLLSSGLPFPLFGLNFMCRLHDSIMLSRCRESRTQPTEYRICVCRSHPTIPYSSTGQQLADQERWPTTAAILISRAVGSGRVGSCVLALVWACPCLQWSICCIKDGSVQLRAYTQTHLSSRYNSNLSDLGSTASALPDAESESYIKHCARPDAYIPPYILT